MSKALLSALLFLTLAPFLPAGEPNGPQFEAICNRARLMNSSEEGKIFETNFRDVISPQLQNVLPACAAKTAPPYVLRLVFLLDGGGKVRHVYYEPGQAAGQCAASKLEGAKVNKPPKADWIIMVSINIGQ